jgi:hypothetical protein
VVDDAIVIVLFAVTLVGHRARSLREGAAARDGTGLISSSGVRHAIPAALAVLLCVLLAGCGEKKETLGDTTAVYGPGIAATAPPWKPEYAHLKQRIARLKLPLVGKEQFHSHALLHVYNEGRLVELPPNIGIDRANDAYAPLHTHDPTGIVHMESERPFKFNLGMFFAIWGVRFGNNSLGSLQNDGDKRMHVYVNGKPVSDPVHYVLQDNDNVVVAYGTADSFPKNPDARALENVSKKGGGNCSKDPNGKGDGKSCLAPKDEEAPDLGGAPDDGGTTTPDAGGATTTP